MKSLAPRWISMVALALTLVLGVGSIARADDGAGAALRFKVSFDKEVRADAATGRLLVFLIRDGAGVAPGADPGDGPFFEDPQPIFGIDVKGLAPGESAVLDDSATSFPAPPSKLAKGQYRVQAVLDLNRRNSSWQREPGNLFSKVVTITFDPADPPAEAVPLKLSQIVEEKKRANTDRVEIFSIKSELLSQFMGREVKLRAGVVLPLNRIAGRAYPAIYEIPGYGGDADEAFGIARGFQHAKPDSAEAELAKSAFFIVLDPESGNGHTLWVNSANNGPWSTALVQELIPALEKKYNLIAKPEARLITGHSSGGWSSLWLTLTQPATFGACWSSSPDPVDFRRFQKTDIYTESNMYARAGAKKDAAPAAPVTVKDEDVPSFRDSAGKTRMTVRVENAVEEVMGPDNTSGQQWDSWLAVFGPRGADGNPAALYDPITGVLNHTVSEAYRRYDIGELLRANPEKYGPLFRQRVRLIVGQQDSFFLNEAVTLLQADLDRLYPADKFPGPGYIKMPNGDHGSVMMSPEARARSKEMLDLIKTLGPG